VRTDKAQPSPRTHILTSIIVTKEDVKPLARYEGAGGNGCIAPLIFNPSVDCGEWFTSRLVRAITRKMEARVTSRCE
jgi:hypothetical protein